MLPDYSVHFLRDKVSPLRFRVRRGANFVHDIQFLSSFLHDARFTPAAITQRGKKLLIPFDRDCWELGCARGPCPSPPGVGPLHAHSTHELYTARSRLTLGPVSSVRWEANDLSSLGSELWVESIYIGAAHWETPEVSEIVITAPHAGWKISISIADDFGDIVLNDLETPHLFASRKP